MSSENEYNVTNLQDIFTYFENNYFHFYTYFTMILSLLKKRITRNQSRAIPCSCCYTNFTGNGFFIDTTDGVNWFNCPTIRNSEYTQGVYESNLKFKFSLHFFFIR